MGYVPAHHKNERVKSKPKKYIGMGTVEMRKTNMKKVEASLDAVFKRKKGQ